MRLGWGIAAVTLVVCSLLAPLVANSAEGAPWPPIEVAGTSVAPGETARIWVDVAQTFAGKSRMPGDYVRKGDVLGTVSDPVTEETAQILAPREGRIIGMAVPQLVLPGYGLFHLGFDPE